MATSIHFPANGDPLSHLCQAGIFHAAGRARKRVALSRASGRRAKFPHSLHDAGSFSERVAERSSPVKQNRTARIIVSVLFVAMLASPLVIKWAAGRRDGAKSKLDAQAALARHGFYFQEVSRAAGVNFVHQAPTLDPQLAPIMPQVASMGASVSVVDFDGDGWPDIYVTNSGEGSKNALYHNLHDGTFKA